MQLCTQGSGGADVVRYHIWCCWWASICSSLQYPDTRHHPWQMGCSARPVFTLLLNTVNDWRHQYPAVFISHSGCKRFRSFKKSFSPLWESVTQSVMSFLKRSPLQNLGSSCFRLVAPPHTHTHVSQPAESNVEPQHLWFCSPPQKSTQTAH